MTKFKISPGKINLALVFAFSLFLAACENPEQRAQSYYEQGIKFFDQGKLSKAKLEFRNALQIDKKLVPAWFGLAKIDEKKRNWPAVVRSLNNVVSLDPKHVAARVKLGNIFLLGGDNTKALEYSDAAIALAPENDEVQALRAAVLFKLSDYQRAKEAANKALEINPKNIGAVIVLAAGRMRSRDAEKALEYIETGLVLNSRDIGLHLFKIRALEVLKRPQQIEAAFQKLVELYPNTVSFQQALAKFYVQQGDNGKAEIVMRKIATKNPDDYAAGLNVVRFVSSVRGAEAAMAELQGLIDKGGKVFTYKLAMVQMHLSQSQPDKALSLLRKLVKQEASSENEVPAKLQLSRLLLATENTQEADGLIEEILKQDNKNTDALMLRANRRIGKNYLDTAIEDLRAVLNEQPRSIPALLLLSRAHELSGSIELADERLAVAAKTAKYAPNVGLRYVRFLMSRGFGERAEDVAQQVLARNSQNVQALTVMAQIKLRRQDWVGAEELSERIRKIDSKNRVSGQILGAALGGQKKYNASIDVLQEAYNETPNAVQPMASLIQAFVRGNKIKEAENFLNAVLEANPKYAEAHILLGQLQLATRRLERGLASFETAIAAQPASVAGYRALSGLYLGQRKFAKAGELLQQGLAKVPERENFVLRLMLASVFEQTGKIDEAIAEYEILNRQQPGSAVVSNNLASLYTETRSDEKSLERAFVLARQFRNSKIPQFQDTLGWTYFKRGEYRKAISLLQEAAQALPNISLVRYHLGMSYLENKQNKEAVVELEKALELAQGTKFAQREQTINALERLKASAAN
jgi:tetratricopeptide (TPR) repeat protein